MARRSSVPGSGGEPGPAEREKQKAVDRDRLLEFFLAHPDEVFSNHQLRDVLGQERSDSWTRRLRDLRKPEHDGYTILSFRDRVGLKSNEYMFPRQQRREPGRRSTVSNRLRGEVFSRDAFT